MRNILSATCLMLLCLVAEVGLSQRDTSSLFVDGVCGMCEDRIETAASKVKGVIQADWDVDSRILNLITKSNYKESKLHKAVNAVGHDTESVKASDEAYNKLHACCKYRDPDQIATHHKDHDDHENHREDDGIKFFVDGICGMCEDRIETAVQKVEGVEKADWNVDNRMLSVAFAGKKIEEIILHQAVAAAGHDTRKVKASEEAYDKLHDCCKYRDASVVAEHRPKDIFEKAPASLSGNILVEENGKAVPLPGVNIYWLDAKPAAVTDTEGKFNLKRPEGANQVVVSYVGYYSDTIALTQETAIKVTLTPGTTLETVEVVYQRKAIEVSFVEPILIQQIGRKELLKAACCNLAESFETNPAVDVSFTDAVTGARQIEMLGLAGPYTQITRENLPDVRGLASIYGLVYIPGPWVKGIQLAKGPGSVINGFESMTGQINVELKKPEEGERAYFNLYANQGGRIEGNANARFEVGDNWFTSFLVHGNSQQQKNDRNQDGFLDMPIGTGWTAVNRWKYQGDDGWNSQFGIKVTQFDKTSGQLNFDQDANQNIAWGARMQTRRLEGWAKIGRVFQNRPDASIGFQLTGSLHYQDASFGTTRYDADQQSFYANLIYSETLGDPAHKLNSGLSLQADQFEEWLAEGFFERNEVVPGAFVEYTYLPNDNFTAVLGLRADHHNQFGFFLTPRLHLRYAANEQSVFRLSAGQGRRTASIIAENLGMLASARSFVLQSDGGNSPYGLNQEVAWNFGLNWRQTFIIQNRELIITVDGYHTRFDQQVVVDYDATPREVRFYNLDGKSFSNTFQAQLDYAVLSNLDLRIAYRFNDVQADYQQGRLERPFVARHRAFANVSYQLGEEWDFDLTFNWQGVKRIPSTAANPAEFQVADRSPDFLMTNAQVSKNFGERLRVYVGGENLFNFVQSHPILGANDPFGDYFDSSLVWGPIFGRMLYAGVHYTIE
ncbi:MAG: TonB-dependent receptor [Saprospiraceae bacterium]|nr:TonB-dependent receptor [Saprospiraceae bacterium]